MLSHSDLLKSSGYEDRPEDFDDLIRILDSEMRLITPTDPAGKETAQDATDGKKYYQLTHDYMVPPLRDWITRSQRQSMAGRAELKLQEQCAIWSQKQQSRHLLSMREFSQVSLLTEKRNWTESQRRVVR